MAESLTSILERLRQRIGVLTAENARLRARDAEITAECEEMRRQMRESEKKRRRAELDAEYLAVSHKLADNPETLVETRRHVDKLIRNIDRCLAMLKE